MTPPLIELATQIKQFGLNLGFQQVGITDLNLQAYLENFTAWLAEGYQGDMHFMAKHQDLRFSPEALVPEAKRAIVVRLDYLPDDPQFHPRSFDTDPAMANISRYAQNRDYHSLIRKRLSQLAHKIEQFRPELKARAFADSAPVLEKPLATKAGLGWQGKHTNLIHPKAGSFFFLGVLYVNLELPIDPPFPKSTHCGTCTACIDICPTQAIIGPYQLDARKCISYLTIEHKGSIPEELRPLMGNRIYGCDDCQLICPWNKFAKASRELAFQSTRGLAKAPLTELFSWTEDLFLKRTEGSAIRRIGHERWLRNIAVALGNAPKTPEVLQALNSRRNDPSELVREHVAFALYPSKV